MIETVTEEGVPTRQPGRPGPTDWTELSKLYRVIVFMAAASLVRSVLGIRI